MKNTYLLGGISITTDISYPELIETQNPPEVELSYADIPEHLEDNTVDFPFIEANSKQFLIKIPRIGRYLVENGNRIYIKAEYGASNHDVEKQVLTSIFGAISSQRNLLCMHGGAFIANGKAILLTGQSGAGKSTMLAGLLKKGYKIASDDISNIRIVNGKAFLLPSFPCLLLWDDTLKALGFNQPAAKRLRGDMEKYIFPLGSSFHTQPVELKKIYVIAEHNSQELLEIKGLKKVETLMANTFKPWMINTFQKQQFYFSQFMSVCNNIEMRFFNMNKKQGIESQHDTLLNKVLEDA